MLHTTLKVKLIWMSCSQFSTLMLELEFRQALLTGVGVRNLYVAVV